MNKLLYIFCFPRCFIENCHQRFNNSISLKEHQKNHIYISEIFNVGAQAFNNTTLVLRKELPQQGLNDFNFITPNESINNVQKNLNSEVVKKSAIAFSVAVTINL